MDGINIPACSPRIKCHWVSKKAITCKAERADCLSSWEKSSCALIWGLFPLLSISSCFLRAWVCIENAIGGEILFLTLPTGFILNVAIEWGRILGKG